MVLGSLAIDGPSVKNDPTNKDSDVHMRKLYRQLGSSPSNNLSFRNRLMHLWLLGTPNNFLKIVASLYGTFVRSVRFS